MTDLRTLTDAFDELAHRGEAAEARMPAGLPHRSPGRSLRRAVPVTVAAGVVVGLAATIAVLAPGGDDGMGAATQPPPPTAQEGAASPLPSGPAAWSPRTPDELADRLRGVLAGSATFVVTETGTPPAPTGAAIIGTITKAGVTGGFELQIYPDSSGRDPWCVDPSNCTETKLPDGSPLAYSTVSLEGGGTTHEAVLVRPGGVLTIMDVSSQRSPKGGSDALAGEPPLTIDDMITILTDPGW